MLVEVALDVSLIMTAMLKRVPLPLEEETLVVEEDMMGCGGVNIVFGCLVCWTRSMHALPAIAKTTTCTHPEIPPSKLA